jgi:DNA-binding XRE family transcriptional regulator
VKNKLFEIINGTLLGDACIQFDNYKYQKYFSYKLSAKDRRFLEWIKLLFEKFELNNCWISIENKNPTKFALYFYINSCPYRQLLELRDKWYKRVNGKSQKIIPRDLELNSIVLLHWYLGDGCLIRRKNDSNRVPYIVLATNTFSKEDVGFLIQKLKELNLNFYPVKYKSGFTKKESGYCLYSNTQDGTPLRFFKLINECPKEIANCSTGRKGIYHEEKFFKNKWPTEDDWIKILSNVKGIGKMLKERRIQMNISRKELTKLLSVNKDYVRKIENGRRNTSVSKFRKILNILNLDSTYLLKKIN